MIDYTSYIKNKINENGITQAINDWAIERLDEELHGSVVLTYKNSHPIIVNYGIDNRVTLSYGTDGISKTSILMATVRTTIEMFYGDACFAYRLSFDLPVIHNQERDSLDWIKEELNEGIRDIAKKVTYQCTARSDELSKSDVKELYLMHLHWMVRSFSFDLSTKSKEGAFEQFIAHALAMGEGEAIHDAVNSMQPFISSKPKFISKRL